MCVVEMFTVTAVTLLLCLLYVGSFAVSGLYIARNARKFSTDEFSDHSDSSDFTYIPDNDTALHTSYTTDISTVDTLNRSYDALGEPLNRTPLPLHQLREPCSQGTTQVNMVNCDTVCVYCCSHWLCFIVVMEYVAEICEQDGPL